jgi:hypothetical protein
LAFLITFSVLLVDGLVWMGLFVLADEADDATLNAIAGWLSPQHVSGWILYAALCIACYVPLARRYLRPRDSDAPPRD